MSNLSCAEATCLWLTENFADCHATLQKIESETKADNKLAHNLLVVEHVLAGSADSDRIGSQLELLANERLAPDDVSTADVVTASSRGRSSGVLDALPLVPVRDDLAVVQLNRAVLLYQRHCYTAAAELLEPLAANAEALAEGTAVRVLTLLLDIYVEARQLPRAVAVLHTLERLYSTLTEAYGSTDRPSGSGGASGSAGGSGGGGSGAGGLEAGHGAADREGHARGGGGGSSSSGGGGACGWRAPRSLELPRVSRWGSGAMVRSRELLEQQGRPPAVPDLKLLIRLYRSRLHALAHNTRAAKRELQAVIAALSPTSSTGSGISASGPSGPSAHAAPAQQPTTAAAGATATAPGAGPLSVPAGSTGGGGGPDGQLLLGLRAGSPAANSLLVAVRAQLELYRGRVRKATKLLLGLMQDPSFADTHRPLLLNNLGLVHHQQGKHTLALLYLSQALAAAAAPTSSATTNTNTTASTSTSTSAPSDASASTGPGIIVRTSPTATTTQATTASGPGQKAALAAAATATAAPCSDSGSSSSSSSTSSVPVPAVMYNAGLQHLLLGNYEAARGCFAAAAVQYSNTPLLWLRTAEAALGLHRRSNAAQHGPGPGQQPASGSNNSSNSSTGSGSGSNSSHLNHAGLHHNHQNHLQNNHSALSAANGPVASAPAAPQQQSRLPADASGPVSGAGPGPTGQAGTTGTSSSPAPTGSSSASAAAGAASSSVTASSPAALLAAAISALQTALQQLDAQQDEHEQWQSSSNKLDEGGVALPMPSASASASAVPASQGAADAAASGPSGTAGSGGGADSDAGSQASLPLPPSGEPCIPSPSAVVVQQQQPQQGQGQGQGQGQTSHLSSSQLLLGNHNHVGQPLSQLQWQGPDQPGQGQEQGQASHQAGPMQPAHSAAVAGMGMGTAAVPGAGAHGQGQGQQLENGLAHEHHGTDASAALAEELRAVRLAVLANLSYAHLQAGDWASALAAARALMDAAAAAAAVTPAVPAAAVGAGPGTSTAAVQAPGGATSAEPPAAVAPPQPQSLARGGPVEGSAGTPTVAAVASGESYSFLAASYMAEALCHLDRPGDAVECLSLWLAAGQEQEAAGAAAGGGSATATAGASRPGPATPLREESNTSTSTGGISAAGAAAATTGRDEVYPLGNAAALAALTGPAALAATYTNLASVFASQGELPQAAGLVRQALALQPSCAPAALLLVYCELAAGNTQAALALLKRAGQQG